jgi:hypothetical protein
LSSAADFRSSKVEFSQTNSTQLCTGWLYVAALTVPRQTDLRTTWQKRCWLLRLTQAYNALLALSWRSHIHSNVWAALVWLGVAVAEGGEDGAAVAEGGEDGVAVAEDGEEGVAVAEDGKDGVAVAEDGKDGVAVAEDGEDGVAVVEDGEDGVAVAALDT